MSDVWRRCKVDNFKHAVTQLFLNHDNSCTGIRDLMTKKFAFVCSVYRYRDRPKPQCREEHDNLFGAILHQARHPIALLHTKLRKVRSRHLRCVVDAAGRPLFALEIEVGAIGVDGESSIQRVKNRDANRCRHEPNVVNALTAVG